MVSDLLLVSDVDRTEADEFVDRHHPKGPVITDRSLTSIGLFTDGRLSALAQFSAPLSDLDRKLYTAEVSRIVFDPDFQDDGALSSMVSFYIERYKPSDLFIDADKLEHSITLTDPLLAVQSLIDELGWRVGTDDVRAILEWFASDVTFYTYRISAADSNKYYYGVSHIKSDNASVEDCLQDGYWGSGGIKFSNWKVRHLDLLDKEVVSIHQTRAAAYAKEKELVGDRWKTDSFCLNSMPGGVAIPPSRSVTKYTLKECSTHGEVIHRGSTCGKCISEATGSMSECAIHGNTYHHGGSCRKCSRDKALTTKICEIHGESAFAGNQCLTCMNLKAVSKKECPEHGLATFQGDTCMVCVADAKTNLSICKIHGETKHYGKTCCKCSSAKRINQSYCDIHGLVTFLDGECSSCTNLARVNVSLCGTHGMTKHQGKTCLKCVSEAKISMKICEIHGEVKHFGNSCASCLAEGSVSERECAIHGLTKHQGDKCSKCTNQSLISLKICPKHGETKHRGASCYRCFSEKNKVILKDCLIHGEAKHQGNSCAKCRIEKRTHNSKHTDSPDLYCQFC